jgi:hypothetical protein
MKKKLSSLAMVAVALMLWACSEEATPLKKIKVQFGFNVAPGENSGGRAADELPAGVKVLLSLSNSSGPVLTQHPLTLHKFGSSYTTDPLELATDSYNVTDFLIESGDGEILYATPKEGSVLAEEIEHPLPFGFTVSESALTNIEMEVVAVGMNPPEAFGYASFEVKVFDPLPVVVFVEKNGTLTMTDAKVTLLRANGLRPEQEINIDAKVNYIDFDGDKNELYYIRILKPGYYDINQTFRYNDLIATLGTSPWKFVLTDVKELVLHRTATTTPWELTLGTIGNGNLQVIWSDGTVENMTFTGNPNALNQDMKMLSHAFASGGQGTQSLMVRGDIEKIFWFQNTSRNLVSVDVGDLLGLETISLYRCNLPVLDLSRNVNLRSIVLDKTDFTDLILDENKLTYVGINEGSTDATHDELAKEVHANTIANNLLRGQFNSYNTVMSAEAVLLLNELKADYEWSIVVPN